MFQKIAKHRANDASNDVHRPPLPTTSFAGSSEESPLGTLVPLLRSAVPLLDRLTRSNKLKSTSSTPSQLAPAQEKILLESTSGDFFGFNTTSFAQRGVLGGIRDSLAGIYDNIVKDYVTDVYTDVIEGYTIATIKLMGWFFFGGFLIAKGAILNGLVDDFGGILLSTITHKHLKHFIELGPMPPSGRRT